MYITKKVESIIQRFEENGFEAYVVGGCVRDSLHGIIPEDWDICTSALPNETVSLFENEVTSLKGFNYGSVEITIEKESFEITTFRSDGEYQDSRRPKSVCFVKSIREDLHRRDFTINAMAYNPHIGLIDIFGGEQDYRNQIIKVIGNPAKRFQEDPLRILRALRFSSKFGFQIEKTAQKAIHEEKMLLLKVSADRIRAELNKLVVGDNVEEVFLTYRDVFGVIIPEIKACFDFQQNTRFHNLDVYEHIIRSVRNAPKDLIIRLCMLLHDIAKPDSYTCDSEGNGHFYGHAQRSAVLAKDVLLNLHYDKKTTREIVTLVKYHDERIYPDEPILLKWLNEIGEELLIKLIDVKRADLSAKNPRYAYSPALLDELEVALTKLLQKNPCYSFRQLNFNGDDVMKLGVKGGKKVKGVLDILLEKVMYNRCENTHRALHDEAVKLLDNKRLFG